MHFSIIAAVDKNFGIGKANSLPWHLPKELAHFSKITIGNGKNAVIMGRKNWESLPAKSRPLKNRINIVLSRNPDFHVSAGVHIADNFQNALQKVADMKCEQCFVIGGGNIYAEAINHPLCREIHITLLEENFSCDTFFPKIDETKFVLTSESETFEEKGIKYKFLRYSKS